MVCYTLCLGSVRFRNRGGKLKFKQTKNRGSGFDEDANKANNLMALKIPVYSQD